MGFPLRWYQKDPEGNFLSQFSATWVLWDLSFSDPKRRSFVKQITVKLRKTLGLSQSSQSI